MTKKTKKQTGRIRRDLTVLNIIYTVIAFVINILMWWSIYSVVRYSSLSKWLFIALNIVVLLILLVMDYLLFMLIRTKKVRFMNTVSAMLAVLLLISGFSTFLVTKVNVNVNKITSSGSGTVKENVETSIVVYSESGTSSITKIEELAGKTVGVIENTNYATLGQEELSAKGVTVSIEPFSDYITAAQALFNGEIDAVIMPNNYVGLLEINDGFGEYLDKTTAISTFSKVVQVETETGSTKDITAEPFTVLILGVDEGRSDAIMVASFNPISMNVTLSSLARDSYVPIACYSGKSSDKLGHARAVSRQCAIDTIEDLLDINIDYYFESNFKGVVEMVDALGGIVVNNPFEFVGQNSSAERGHKTVWIPAGENVPLNGEQALAFARERHLYSTGDFQRQANQQQVIQSILREVVRLRDVSKGVAMMDAAGENVKTNMSIDQLISLFNYTMKKVNRYYDKEHVEDVFNIIGSRVTGYGDNIWNEGMQSAIYYYRLFEGAIKDTRAAIERNIDMTSAITAPKEISWNAKWEFVAPVIANETYAEKVIVSEVPDTLPNYTTVGKLQSWAKAFNITVNIEYIGEGMEGYDASKADGTIIWQDVATGSKASTFTVINVKVIKKDAKPVTACPTDATGTHPNCVCTDTTKKYNKDKNVCEVPAPTTGTEFTLTVKYVNKDNNTDIQAATTQKVVGGQTYTVTPTENITVGGVDYKPEHATYSGTMPSNDASVTVYYVKSGGGTTPACPAGSSGTHPNCVCTDANQQYNKDKNVCEAKPQVELKHTWTDTGKIVTESVCNADGTSTTGKKEQKCPGDANHKEHFQNVDYNKTGCTVQPVPCSAPNTSGNVGACVCIPGYTGDANSAAGCSADPNTEIGCKALSKFWYDGACHDTEKPA